MDHKSIVKFCKDLGCCDACCIRYLGLKNPDAYENVHQFILQYLNIDPNTNGQLQDSNVVEQPGTNIVNKEEVINTNNVQSNNGPVDSTETNKLNTTDIDSDDRTSDMPPSKRIKLDNICVSCLGVLQEETWPEAFSMIKEVLDKKRYECDTIACALSSPIASIFRERVITLRLEQEFPGYEHSGVMSLKEAWKWSFGRGAAARAGRRLQSGAVAPLLVTLGVQYDHERAELELLRDLAPAVFSARARQRRKFAEQYTRRAVDDALAHVSLAALAQRAPAWRLAPPRPAAAARAHRAHAAHAPLYLAGRYIKLSRELPQTPWLVAGRRMMHSSVQEIIFEPIAPLFGLSSEEAASGLKFMSAGREDVDVRCLGSGRPFAVEIADPRRRPSGEELQRACDVISAGGQVIVKTLVPISREHLTQLKRGERTKCKTYEALCVKLAHSREELAAGASGPPAVTARDIHNINTYRNTAEGEAARVLLQQRTPLRVLHRRALLLRARRVLALSARAVPARPALFVLRARTDAGTYVKEWAHGELRRTRPSLAAALRAPADILALDVTDVDLPWPPGDGPADAPADLPDDLSDDHSDDRS